MIYVNSSRMWITQIYEEPKESEMIQYLADLCVNLYVKKEEGDTLLVCFYMDHVLICSNTKVRITELISHLNANFIVQEEEDKYFIGYQMKRNTKSGKLKLHQTHYIVKC